MTGREDQLLALRYMEVEAELRAIFEGRRQPSHARAVSLRRRLRSVAES